MCYIHSLLQQFDRCNNNKENGLCYIYLMVFDKMNVFINMELLNSIVNHVSCANNTNDTLHKLLLMGFLAEELISEFHFDEDEVKQAEMEYYDD